MNKKSWFSYQDMVIHENEGPISVIEYSYPFVAWCNEYGTKVFNVETETNVTFVPKPSNVPETNQCRPRLSVFPRFSDAGTATPCSASAGRTRCSPSV